MSIYIARGDNTLGPYTVAQAAELVRHGDLRTDDYAARDGDAEWVALESFLPGPAAGVPATPPKPRRHRVRTALVLLLLGAAAVSLLRLRRSPTPVAHPVLRSEMPAPLVIVPTTANSPGAAATPLTPAPPASTEPPGQKPARLAGTVLPAGPAVVRVSAYPLATLEPFLARKRAEMQAEIDGLAPQIAAAVAERAGCIDNEHRTLQAIFDAAPDDEMSASLVFAHDQAKAAVATAERSCRYLDDQRQAALDAAGYFQDLPPPVAMAQTDAEGGFTLELPAGGPYAVAASASGTTPDGPRPRYWLVKVPAPEAGQPPLLLSNANALSTGTDAPLIQ